MVAPAWDDLGAFLSEDDFAVQAVISSGGVVRPAIAVIFDDPHFSAELGEYTAETGSPRMTCKASDVAGVKKRDTCVIAGVTYTVAHDPRPDGTGMAQVDLMLAAV